MYWALNKCIPGVLSLRDLNIQISEYYEERTKWDQSFKKEYAGIPNVTWHQSCIYKALKKKYGKGNFVWKKVSFHGMVQFLKSSHKGAKFYLHGKLNSTLFEYGKSGDDWAHAICIDPQNNKFYDNTCYSLMRGRSINKCFVKCNIENRYMSEIHRVYRLEIVEEISKRRRSNNK